VLGGVAGGLQGAQSQPAEVDLVAVTEPQVVEGALPGGRGEDLRTVIVSELPGAGKEIGVQVGLGRVRDPQTPLRRGSVDGTQVQGRVNREGTAVAEVEQVGTIAQPLVNQ